MIHMSRANPSFAAANSGPKVMRDKVQGDNMSSANHDDVPDVLPDVSPDVLIVGAGFSGLYMIHKMRQNGFSVQAVEAAPDIGGTWYHNRYPGLRCDVESLEYSYSFSQDLRDGWTWTERYPAQPEILRYAHFVADRLDLLRDITLNTRITSAHWDSGTGRWIVTSETGQTWNPRFLVMGTGCLSVPRYPNIPGIADFEGTLVHTADWPEHGVDLDGKTVGLIGTGSSGVQTATDIAERAGQLTVFQRNPAYTIPAQNRPLTAQDHQDFRDNFAELDALARSTSSGLMVPPPQNSAQEVSEQERKDILTQAWNRGGAFRFTGAFNDVRLSETSNTLVCDFVRDRIRDIVRDPATAEALCPQDFIATRRVCVDTGYFEIFNRPDVALVDVAQDPIAAVTKTGVRLASGARHELDVLILATGYDAMTGALLSIDIKGEDGISLRDAWADGPKTYLGLAVSGFPNLFTVTGPGSPSVLSNMLRSIEHHVEWITDCLVTLRDQGKTRIMAEPAAQDDWVTKVNAAADKTLFTKAASWYMGADIPGKPRVFMPYAGGLPAYVAICGAVADQDYVGFDHG